MIACVVLGCRRAPIAGPAASLPTIDGVPIRDWHLAHIDGLVACMQRHGTPGLVRGPWQQEGSDWAWPSASVRLPLGSPPEDAWIRVFWRHRADGEPGTAHGLQIRLRRGRIELTYAEETQEVGSMPAGRVAYFVGDGRAPEFWIDLAGPDLFAPLRDPARARDAARASLDDYQRLEEARIDDLRHVDPFRSRGRSGGPASDGEKDVERARLRSDLARRHVALERSLPDLLDEVRRLYPIEDPACALGLPRRTRDP